MFKMRSMLAEHVFGLAAAICPSGYTPSWVTSIADAYYHRGEFSDDAIAADRAPDQPIEIPMQFIGANKG